MKLLLLNWKDVEHPKVGGAELIVHYFAQELVKAGHEVTLVCSSFPGAKPETEIDGVRIIRRGSLYTVFWHAYRYYKQLKEKPDFVIEHINTIGWMTPLYVPAEKRRAYLNQLAQAVWMYEFPWPLSWIGFVMERLQYLLYKTTTFLCYSQSTQDNLISYGIPAENIRQFTMGLDHTRYVPGEKKTKYPLFLFVARLVSMKRPRLCFEAFLEVLKKHPEAKFVFIGQGPEQFFINQAIYDHEVQRSVKVITNAFFVDKKSKDPKVTYMQQAWAHVLPSVKEGWGMVVTETAACGTPSIVSNVSGLRDSVQDGKSGVILSENPSKYELAEAMIRIIEDEPLRQKLSAGAIKWAKNFEWEKSYRSYVRALSLR
jgi:glycosyltransferase involved in cell wall biosynthesis